MHLSSTRMYQMPTFIPSAIRFTTHTTAGIVLQQEEADKNEAPLLRSKGPQRQEQKESAEESARATHVGDGLKILHIKCRPYQIWGFE